MNSFSTFIPTRLFFGRGVVKTLHEKEMPGKKAMVTLSSGKSTRANGYLDTVLGELDMANVEYVIFDKLNSNPTLSSIHEGAEFAKDNECDFVVALGGGSTMDSSKHMALMATNEGSLWDYMNKGTGKSMTPKNPALPIICITTTAGTGSEVDPWGVVNNEDTHEKLGFGVDSEFPVYAFVDPELMTTVPPNFTAYQGFDAFLQVVECYNSTYANYISDMLSLEAIRHIAKNLPKAVANGNDIEAREHMAIGNTLSGMAMVTSGCISEHSMEHELSAKYPNLPHGAGLIMLSKAYWQYYVDNDIHSERFVDIARAMGYEDAKEPQDFINALVKLHEDCGVADLKMSDFGITEEDLPYFVKAVRKSYGRPFDGDPTDMSDDDVLKIYKDSYFKN